VIVGVLVNISKESAKIKLTWRRENAEDIEKAREFFMNLTKQGWLATRRNGRLQRILEFKPEYEELLFLPVSEGG